MENNRNMEEKTASSVNINIYGGTNQILPNATKAEQHFHYEQGKQKCLPPMSRPTHGLLMMNAAFPSI